MQYLMDYEDKKFQNVSKEGLKLGKDSKLKDLKESFKLLSPAARQRDHRRAQGLEETQREVAGEHESWTHEFWCRHSSVF